MRRLERALRLHLLTCLAAMLLGNGCARHHEFAPASDADSGPRAEFPAEDAGATVVLAPSGAAAEPSVAAMSSEQFQLMGSMRVSSGGTIRSKHYELRAISLHIQR